MDIGETQEHGEANWHGPAPWFHPSELVSIVGRLVMLSTFRDFLDKRELQRGLPDDIIGIDRTDEVLVDYIADTGDGFTATYSVLRQLNPDALGHGDMLVLGGDQVYPTPTARAYHEKLTAPLAAAVPIAFLEHVSGLVAAGDIDGARRALEPTGDGGWHAHQIEELRVGLERAGRGDLMDRLLGEGSSAATADATEQLDAPLDVANPLLVAIPGNHDWYDGLTAFGREFMQPGERIGAYETAQQRSYWAVDVEVDGARWWMWGIDISLDADVDRAQLDYFVNCGAAADEPIVLFVAAPLWTYAPHRSEQLFRFEQQAIHALGRRLALVLAGDRHYYMRREAGIASETGGRRADAPPRITAGLGGAFTHPPHLEKAVPMLWEAEPDRHGRSQRTLPYVAAQIPDGAPHRRPSDDRQSDGGPDTGPVTVSFPDDHDSRRIVGLRHSFAAWWRWNRSFTIIPMFIALLTATTTLQTSEFWRQDADFSETSFWQIGTYFVLGFNLIMVLFLYALAFFLAAPDPAAHFQRSQRMAWTALHGTAQVGSLWLSMWAAQRIAAAWSPGAGEDEVGEGIVFLGLSAAIGAVGFTVVLILYFWVTNRAQMSVNALASWNLDQNHVGIVRLRFTADAIHGEVHGITDVKTENPDKIWRRIPDPRGTEARIEPRWQREPLVLVDRFRVDRLDRGVGDRDTTEQPSPAS